MCLQLVAMFPVELLEVGVVVTFEVGGRRKT